MNLGGIGYEGSITRFNSFADAQNGLNATETMRVQERDLSLLFARNDSAQSDRNLLMGAGSDNGSPQLVPTNDPARSASGLGVMQLLDVDGSTGTDASMRFDTFDGTHFTRFNLSVRGENATSAEDGASLALSNEQMAAGVWRSWAVDLTVSGLRGSEIEPGVIQATGGPSSLQGTLTGIFEMFPDGSGEGEPAYFAIEFDLGLIDTTDGQGGIPLLPIASLDYTGQGDNALGPGVFRAVQAIPMTTPLALAGACLLGIAGLHRRR